MISIGCLQSTVADQDAEVAEDHTAGQQQGDQDGQLEVDGQAVDGLVPAPVVVGAQLA